MPPDAAAVADRLVTLKACIVYALGAPPREVVGGLRARMNAEERANMEEKADEARDAFWTPIYDTPVFEALTASERELSEATLITITEEQQINASWWLEGAAMLAWALGAIEELPPFDLQVEPELLGRIPNPSSLATFRNEARLRPVEELEAARSAAELWNWRSRTRELQQSGFTMPEELKKPGMSSLDDVVRLTTAHAMQEGTIARAIDGDFGARGKAYGALSDDEWHEVRSVAVERHRALNWLCGRAPDNAWDATPIDT